MSSVTATNPGVGIHALTSDEYHADPCYKPSLSASIATLLCQSSPAHAWASHPRLNPEFKREEKAHFDLGTIVHQLLLEGHTDSLVAIEAPDFRTKAAQEERDAAYAAGHTPILTKNLPTVQGMVESVGAHLKAHYADPPLFTDGKAEQTLIWEEPGEIVCRARVDWLRDDLGALDDLKTTSGSANPEGVSRRLFDMGYDLKAAFYLRGLQMLTGSTDTEFRWCFVETSPPYALSVVSPGPDVLAIGQKKVAYALELWRKCLASGDWPGYTQAVAYAELPGWEEARWLAKEEREAA